MKVEVVNTLFLQVGCCKFSYLLPGVHFVSKLLYTRGSGCRGDCRRRMHPAMAVRRLDVKRWNWDMRKIFTGASSDVM